MMKFIDILIEFESAFIGFILGHSIYFLFERKEFVMLLSVICAIILFFIKMYRIGKK